VATALALTTPSAAGSQAVTNRDVEIRLPLHAGDPARSQRIADTVASALRRFTDWYGPFPHAQLTVVDASRWIQPETDRSLERSLIAGVAQQYWIGLAGSAAGSTWLAEGLSRYSAIRGIHAELEGRHPVSVRYFGGFIPLLIRSLSWSPSPDDRRPRALEFAEVAPSTREGERAALALHTLERYLGWPAFQQALETFQTSRRRDADPVAGLIAVVSEQRGRDMAWFFDEAFRFDAVFDYGIDAFTTGPAAGAPATFVTSLSLRRYGDGVFAGTSDPRSGPYAGGRSLPVVIRFADGTEARAWWDGREAKAELRYTSASPAVMASVDPDAFLLLDADRTNNTKTLRPSVNRNGVRMTLRWLLWLQNAMLAYSGLA
jgi:hypothetical protein